MSILESFNCNLSFIFVLLSIICNLGGLEEVSDKNKQECAATVRHCTALRRHMSSAAASRHNEAKMIWKRPQIVKPHVFILRTTTSGQANMKCNGTTTSRKTTTKLKQPPNMKRQKIINKNKVEDDKQLRKWNHKSEYDRGDWTAEVWNDKNKIANRKTTKIGNASN